MRRAVVRERCCRRWSTACTAQAPAPNQSGERVVRRPVQIPLVGLRGVRGTPQPYPKHCRDRRWDPRCAGVGYPVSRDGPMGLGAAHLLGDGTSNHKTRAGGGGGGGPVEFAGSPTIEFAAATDASIHRRRPGTAGAPASITWHGASRGTLRTNTTSRSFDDAGEADGARQSRIPSSGSGGAWATAAAGGWWGSRRRGTHMSANSIAHTQCGRLLLTC